MSASVAVAPIRTPLVGAGGMISQPWAQFFNALVTALAAVPAQTPSTSATLSDASVPIQIGGVVYYLRLSTTP